MTDCRWLPNFFIAGAPKAGTSSMFRWIADHLDAFGSKDKETYFFVNPGTHMYRPQFHVSNGLDSYRAQFEIPEDAHPAIILEATPSYSLQRGYPCPCPWLADPPPLPVHAARSGGAGLFAVPLFLRDWDWIPRGMSFAEYLAAVEGRSHRFKWNAIAQNAPAVARCAEFLERWRDRLGEDRMMVASIDAFRRDPAGLTRRIAQWLGLNPASYHDYAVPRESETYAVRNHALQSVNVALRGWLPKVRPLLRAQGAVPTPQHAKAGGGRTRKTRYLSMPFAADRQRQRQAGGGVRPRCRRVASAMSA